LALISHAENIGEEKKKEKNSLRKALLKAPVI